MYNSETFPTVAVGIKYQDIVDNFDINLDEITNYLRSRGLSDAQITETKILFSDEPCPRDDKGYTLGIYNDRSKTITIYRDDGEMHDLDGQNDDFSRASTMINKVLTHELEHRVASFDIKQKKLNRKYKLKRDLFSLRSLSSIAFSGGLGVGAYTIYNSYIRPEPTLLEVIAIAGLPGIIALKSVNHIFKNKIFQEYVNSPEEKRARSAKVNHDFVKVTLKAAA